VVAEYAEFIIGPAESRTRWLFPPYARGQPRSPGNRDPCVQRLHVPFIRHSAFSATLRLFSFGPNLRSPNRLRRFHFSLSSFRPISLCLFSGSV